MPSSLSYMAEFPCVLWLNSIPWYIYLDFITHFFIDGHFAIIFWLNVNNAAVNMGIQLSFWVSVFVSFFLEVKLLDHMVVLFLTFWEISILFSIVTVLSYNHTINIQMFPFLCILISICFWSFWILEVRYNYGFDLYFPN